MKLWHTELHWVLGMEKMHHNLWVVLSEWYAVANKEYKNILGGGKQPLHSAEIIALKSSTYIYQTRTSLLVQIYVFSIKNY